MQNESKCDIPFFLIALISLTLTIALPAVYYLIKHGETRVAIAYFIYVPLIIFPLIYLQVCVHG